MALLWIGLSVYAFLLSPNQTPLRDSIFIERLVGLGEKDGFVVNPVYASVFNLIGFYTVIFASLLVPAGRSANKVPAWPFIALSFGFGAFALLPYMMLWTPLEGNKLPPPKEELEGWNKLFMKGAETPWLPASLLLGSLYFVYQAITADASWWPDYLRLFDESRLVHVSTIDFATLTALVPFWMSNDAQLRNWEGRDKLVPLLSVLPVVGPSLYLLLRPKTDLSAPSQ